MSSKDEIGTAAKAAADRMKSVTDAIAAVASGVADISVVQGYAQELRDETNRMLALLDQPAVPAAMREVIVREFGAVSEVRYFAVQVDAGLKPTEQRDAAVALVKAGGQEAYERRTGDPTSAPAMYGTDIDGLIQP